jgi:REP element-mobilizing transposase RayT
MVIGKIYFWTASIKNWQPIFLKQKPVQVIINSLQHLSSLQLIDVFAFVIMPNHIHLIWRINKLNGKEKPTGSFVKYTAHEILKHLKEENCDLTVFSGTGNRRTYQLWNDDPMAIELYTKEVIEQKLEYIHRNPISIKWKLCDSPEEYKYSSANFYKTGASPFEFLKDYRQSQLI